MCWVLTRSDDQGNGLEEKNRWWRENWWKEVGMPVIVFGGDVYTYATVPGLADARGRQPVVMVDTYEYEPKVMPVALDVDRLFDTLARYLEAKTSDPDYQESGETSTQFPWNATGMLARDARLVEMMRAGRFEPLMKNADEETRRWAEKVMGAGE
jgi:hypothetical protein